MKKVLQYIITFALVLLVLAFMLINIFSSTILNKNYILSKLNEEDYYNKIYESAYSNFENYINQSGLDEEVLDNIITKEKIENDSKIVINSIYGSIKEEISTEEIEDKLRQNINSSIKRQTTDNEKKAIESFINTICEEYKTTISYINNGTKINSIYSKIMRYLDIIKKVLLIAIFICGVLLIILSMTKVYEIFAKVGIICITDSLILLISKYYINFKIRIEDITILNNEISAILRNILNDILNTISQYGIILLVLGIVLVVLYGIVESLMKNERIHRQYTTEK